jgi:hypothetical protein
MSTIAVIVILLAMGAFLASWIRWIILKNMACTAAGDQVSKWFRYNNLPINARKLEGRAAELAIKSNRATIIGFALLAVIVATAALDVRTFNGFVAAAIAIAWLGILSMYVYWISQPKSEARS